ncbi:MAG: PilZ domain-containing protein [Thermoanaerobaculia bacterium]
MAAEDMDVREARSVERYIVQPPLGGAFAGSEIAIFDFAERGVQAEHEVALRPGTTGKITFQLTPRGHSFSLPARVVWSHLSKRANEQGKLMYRSGFRMDGDLAKSRDALRQLVESAQARPDDASLDRKKEVLLAKQQKIQAQRSVRRIVAGPRVSSDELLLVQHARERLHLNPDEARKWYNRAKFSLIAAGEAHMPYREDVLAIWEYLERSVDLDVITQVLEEEHLR